MADRDRIEFIFESRHFAVVYSEGHRVLEEYITPKRRQPYWREVSRFGRSYALRKHVLGNRSKRDFQDLGEQLRYVALCMKAA